MRQRVVGQDIFPDPCWDRARAWCIAWALWTTRFQPYLLENKPCDLEHLRLLFLTFHALRVAKWKFPSLAKHAVHCREYGRHYQRLARIGGPMRDAIAHSLFCVPFGFCVVDVPYCFSVWDHHEPEIFTVCSICDLVKCS